MSTKDPRIEVVEVTPEMAATWLENNPHNRSIRVKHVEALAADMKSGDWRLNGETIKITSDGVLVDGQNRLSAIVEADVPVRTFVAFNVPMEDQTTVDTGAKRTLGDVLKLNKVSNPVTVAAILTRVWTVENGSIRNPLRPSVSQALRLYEDNMDDIDEAARVAARTVSRLRVKIPLAPIGSCYFYFSRIDPEDADVFFEKLGTGADLSVGDGIYALRSWITLRAAEKGQMDTTLFHAVIIKGWNAWRDGKVTHFIKWQSGGSRPENFPEPH